MSRRSVKAVILVLALLVIPCAVLLASAKVRLVNLGHAEGLFLLRGASGTWLEIRDDVLLGEESQVLAGVSFNRLHVLGPPAEEWSGDAGAGEGVFLEYRWNAKEGNGYVVNHLGDGRILLTNLSRYIDSDGLLTHGLFVGGGRPDSLRPDSPWRGNDTGMAYFDGTHWSHIWCNTNEGIGSALYSWSRFAPSAWQFLGSQVETRTDRELVLVSRHAVTIDGMPLQMERRALFVAGQPFFDLRITLTNVGRYPGSYFYLYGDEPWLGSYGGSAGDVGWIEGRTVNHEEIIDPTRYSIAGMVDYGNQVIGEGPRSHTANFIEWLGPNRPNVVFFANRYDGFDHPASLLVPLSGDARSIGLFWGPKQIYPGEAQVMSMVIGMADIDPLTGAPRKPSPRMAHSRPAPSGKGRVRGAS